LGTRGPKVSAAGRKRPGEGHIIAHDRELGFFQEWSGL
jgi:hypothetical protein